MLKICRIHRVCTVLYWKSGNKARTSKKKKGTPRRSFAKIFLSHTGISGTARSGGADRDSSAYRLLQPKHPWPSGHPIELR